MNRSSDEILKDRKSKLGDEFGSAFHALSNEWTWALLRLNEYRRLFGRKDDVAFLNALTGGSFLWDVQQNFWADLLLRLCRLTDPPKSGGKRNITIQALPPFVKKKKPRLSAKVEDLVGKAVAKTRFARDWRNRRISHSAWDITIKPAKPLAAASLQQVQDALDAVHAVLNAIELGLMNAELANMVGGAPRAGEFICRARQLADSAKFIDDLVDGESATEYTDLSVARKFLKKVGRETKAKNLGLIMDARKAAQRFAQT